MSLRSDSQGLGEGQEIARHRSVVIRLFDVLSYADVLSLLSPWRTMFCNIVLEDICDGATSALVIFHLDGGGATSIEAFKQHLLSRVDALEGMLSFAEGTDAPHREGEGKGEAEAEAEAEADTVSGHRQKPNAPQAGRSSDGRLMHPEQASTTTMTTATTTATETTTAATSTAEETALMNTAATEAKAESDALMAPFMSQQRSVTITDGPLVQPPPISEGSSCPICLEALEGVGCLANTPCKHIFHAQCLQQHLGTSCPVCRTEFVKYDENHERQTCSSCKIAENLWLCLACGYVGCGRSQWHGASSHAAVIATPSQLSQQAEQGHALSHYLETTHQFARHVENGRIWDYEQDCYIDGKEDQDGDPDDEAVLQTELNDSLQLEYAYLASQQLEEQAKQLRHQLQEAQQHSILRTSGLRSKLKDLEQKHARLTTGVAHSLAELKSQRMKAAKLDAEIERIAAMKAEEVVLLEPLREAYAQWSVEEDAKGHEPSTPSSSSSSSLCAAAPSPKKQSLQRTLATLVAKRDALLLTLTATNDE